MAKSCISGIKIITQNAFRKRSANVLVPNNNSAVQQNASIHLHVFATFMLCKILCLKSHH